jgi:hypothetical protein
MLYVNYLPILIYSTTADEAIGISNEARELSPEDLMFAERDVIGAAGVDEPLSRRELDDHHHEIVAREILLEVLEPLFKRALSRRDQTYTCYMCGNTGYRTQAELDVSRFDVLCLEECG